MAMKGAVWYLSLIWATALLISSTGGQIALVPTPEGPALSPADAPLSFQALPGSPGPAPSSIQPITNAPTNLGSIVSVTPIAPYLNGTTFPYQMLQNLTYRFVGAGLSSPTPGFKQVINDLVGGVCGPNNCSAEILYRPGVQVNVTGPDGVNGSRSAYAPTPGYVPENFRRRLQQSFGADAYNSRFIGLMSIDVEMRIYGGSNSSIFAIPETNSLNGYLVVQMAGQGINITRVMPLNMSTTYDILPVTNGMPLAPTYVLGSVLSFLGSGYFPANTQGQNLLLLTLTQIFGSQPKFLYNRIQLAYQDEANGVMKLAILSYTTSLVQSMNDIAGGNVAALMDQIAAAATANFTATVLESKPLGLQSQELTGNTSFILNINVENQFQAPRTGGGLSGGDIAGIVIGAVAAVAIGILLTGFLWWRQRRQRVGAAAAQDPEKPSIKQLSRAILDSGSGNASGNTSPGDSKASSKSKSGPTTPSGEITPRQSYTFSALSDAWLIKPEELAICQLPNGKDWLLGSGSFGLVFRGLRGGVQDVAIKQLYKPGALQLKMFEKEVGLLRHLNFDKNLVQFLGACIADDNLMLVLEYMDGGDLKDAICNDSPGLLLWGNRGGSILCDIARGLHFLHSNRVAHRDLKSKNILLTRSFEAKIADIGLAKLVGSQLMSTQLDVAGTFAYAAPEMLLNEPCDTRADMYSLGVIIYEVVTHETPVRGGMRAINVPSEAPPEVADLVLRCLERDPAKRPTAKDAFDVLQTLAACSKFHSNLPTVTEESNPLSSNSTRNSRLSSTYSTIPQFLSNQSASGQGLPQALNSQTRVKIAFEGEDHETNSASPSSTQRSLSSTLRSPSI